MPDASTRSLPLAPVVIVLVMVAAGALAFVGDGLPTDYCCPCLPGERLPGCEHACDACEDEVVE